VSKTIFGSFYETGSIDYRGVAYHILITLFLLNLTTNQQEMFASIVEFSLILNEKATKQCLLNHAVPLSQTSPTKSMSDFCNIYLGDPESVVSNLACPEVQFIHGRGYISILECIVKLLAHGLPVNALNGWMKLPSDAVRALYRVGN
jgi:hypothetical protein